MAGGAQAKISTWFSKPNQILISKVTKKRVGFNLKIFVFALPKTVHCRAERNAGRIGRLFNCNDRCFFIWREAPKPKCLPGLVSPIKGETSNSGYQFPFAASCQAKSSFLVLGNNDTDISKNQADSDENKATEYGKSSWNVATNVSNTSNTVVASSVTSSVSIDNGIKKKKKTSLTLRESEMSPSLGSELSKVQEFYSLPIKCDHGGNAKSYHRWNDGKSKCIAMVLKKRKRHRAVFDPLWRCLACPGVCTLHDG